MAETYVRNSRTFQQTNQIFVNVSGTYQEVNEAYANVSGTYKLIFTAFEATSFVTLSSGSGTFSVPVMQMLSISKQQLEEVVVQ